MTDKALAGPSLPVLSSVDIVKGLGAAPRALLAALVALYDDGSLQARLRTIWDKWRPGQADDPASADAAGVAEGLKKTVQHLLDSKLSNHDLRLLLWIRLRESFQLPPKCFASPRTASKAADDLVARTLGSLQAGRTEAWLESCGWKTAKDRPATLDLLARMTLNELLVAVLSSEDEQSAQVREKLLGVAKAAIHELDPESRQKLLDSVGADKLNDAALMKILITGGGLAVFGSAVSMAGFSAYILAAQLSALIPFISGPTLVSLVSMLSNPITFVVGTVGMAWWAVDSANSDIRMAISARVVALLSLNGALAGEAAVRTMIDAFPRLPKLPASNGFGHQAVRGYIADWQIVAPVYAASPNLDPSTLEVMERRTSVQAASSAGRVDEVRNAVALGVMSLGDILYHTYSIDPLVIQAADFSRVQDLNDALAFSGFAHRVQAMADSSALGAVSNLKGYVAERVVATQLVAQGHVVDFPVNANEAGWDIAVDGMRYQVKNVQRLSDLNAHFAQNPEYPVIANSELAGQLSHGGQNAPDWSGDVHFVEGYSNELVEHVTRGSLEAGDAMLHSNVPLFAMLLTGIQGFRRSRRGEITGSQAVHEVLLEGSTRAGLAVVGGFVGTSAGLLVFGPAGALVLGTVGPILSQTQARNVLRTLDNAITSRPYHDWRADVEVTLQELVAKLEKIMRQKADLIRNRRPTKESGPVGDYLDWRLQGELQWLQEASHRLQAIAASDDTIEERVSRLMHWLASGVVFPAQLQTQIVAMSEQYGRRPALGMRISSILGGAIEGAKKTTKDGLESIISKVGKLKDRLTQ